MALPNTIKARPVEEMKTATVVMVRPFVEPADNPEQLTFPWKINAFNLGTGIQFFQEDFDIFQRWDPWYIGLGFFGCIGSCLLSPFVNKRQGVNHRKSDIVKVAWSEFVPPPQSQWLVYPKEKSRETCHLFVKTNFDPNTVAATQGEKVLKYVFVLETGSEESRKLHELLVSPETKLHATP